MFIIDRYLLRFFIRVLVFSFLSMTGLFIMVDTAGNLDEFLAYGKQTGSTVQVLVDYYGPRVLQFFDRTSAVLSLIAAMFTVGWLQRTNELTAILAGGIPKSRVIRPLVAGALVVSLLAVANRELLIPKLRDRLIYNAQNMMGETARPMTPAYDNETEVFFDGRAAMGKERRIDDVKLELPPSLSAFATKLTAKRAYHKPAQGDRPAGFLLEEVDKPADFAKRPSARIGDRTIIFTPADSEGLEPNQVFVASNLEFEQLAAGPAWQDLASTKDLIIGLRRASLDYGAGTRVRVHARLLQPVLDMTLLLLGLPLAFGRDNRNLFLAIGTSLLLVCLFYVVTLSCHGLGSIYLIRPSLAAWLPILVFAPAAVALSRRIWE